MKVSVGWNTHMKRPKVELYNMDCMEAMKEMPDKSFDLAIVDPPYGIGDFNQKRSREIHKKITWNKDIPTEEYFRELKRVSKNRIIWGCNYYAKHIDDVGRLIHDKTGGGRRKQLYELSDCDLASHSFGVNMKIFHYQWMGNVQGETVNWKNDGADARIHPCQKPIQLYKWILLNYAPPQAKILDTHLGSGSIAIACYDMGFDLTGYEIDKDYYDAAVKRLDNHKKQLTFI